MGQSNYRGTIQIQEQGRNVGELISGEILIQEVSKRLQCKEIRVGFRLNETSPKIGGTLCLPGERWEVGGSYRYPFSVTIPGGSLPQTKKLLLVACVDLIGPEEDLELTREIDFNKSEGDFWSWNQEGSFSLSSITIDRPAQVLRYQRDDQRWEQSLWEFKEKGPRRAPPGAEGFKIPEAILREVATRLGLTSDWWKKIIHCCKILLNFEPREYLPKEEGKGEIVVNNILRPIQFESIELWSREEAAEKLFSTQEGGSWQPGESYQYPFRIMPRKKTRGWPVLFLRVKLSEPFDLSLSALSQSATKKEDFSFYAQNSGASVQHVESGTTIRRNFFDLFLLDSKNAQLYKGQEQEGKLSLPSAPKTCACDALTLTPFWEVSSGSTKKSQKLPAISLAKKTKWAANDSYEYPFGLSLSRQPSTYRGKLFQINWFLSAYADIPWALDIEEHFPFELLAKEDEEPFLGSLYQPHEKEEKRPEALFKEVSARLFGSDAASLSLSSREVVPTERIGLSVRLPSACKLSIGLIGQEELRFSPKKTQTLYEQWQDATSPNQEVQVQLAVPASAPFTLEETLCAVTWRIEIALPGIKVPIPITVKPGRLQADPYR